MGRCCFNTVDTLDKRIFKAPELCSSTAPSGILANFSRHFFLISASTANVARWLKPVLNA